MNFDLIEQKYQKDIDAVIDYENGIYNHLFADEFSEILKLSDAIKQSGYRSPSDEVLEVILIDVPLKLFDVAERLNQLELTLQVLKLELKEKKVQLKHCNDVQNLKSTEISDYITSKTIEDELMICVYTKLIERVNSQVSYSKELIMSAKKLWDRRKAAESVMPVSPVDPASAPYDPSKSNKNPVYGVPSSIC